VPVPGGDAGVLQPGQDLFLSGIMARVLGTIRVSSDDGAAVPLKAWIHRHAFASWLAPENASLAFALCFVLVWTAIVFGLYRRRIFIKL
jgi:predicted acyltransferase